MLTLCCAEKALHGMVMPFLLRRPARFHMKLFKKQCDLRGNRETRMGEGGKNKTKKMWKLSVNFRNFEVFLPVLNLQSSRMCITLLFCFGGGGCGMQILYKTSHLSESLCIIPFLIKYSCFSLYTHTHTHTHTEFHFSFAVLRKLNNVYSVLTMARLGHSSCRYLALGATVKRESGKTQHAVDGFPMCSVTQSCPTLCNPLDCSQPGSSVHGILQARILDRVAMPSSRGSSQPKD